MVVKSFMVKGSGENIYEVLFERIGDSLSVRCTCRAGSLNQMCKHKLQLLSGEYGGLIGDEHEFIEEGLSEIIRGTDVELEFRSYSKLSVAIANLENDFKKAKKKLSRLLARQL